MAEWTEDGPVDETAAAAARADVPQTRAPKYRAPGFMQAQIALWHRARSEGMALRRYGDNDGPIPAVTPISAIRSIRPVRELGNISRRPD
jgi:hypothetical protein